MIWVDMDGTLVEPDNADFSKRSWSKLGRALWSVLQPMGAGLLSLGRDGAEYDVVKAQKLAWIAREMAACPPARVEICRDSHGKGPHIRKGDFLIDDAEKHRSPCEGKGGTFIHWRPL